MEGTLKNNQGQLLCLDGDKCSCKEGFAGDKCSIERGKMKNMNDGEWKCLHGSEA